MNRCIEYKQSITLTNRQHGKMKFVKELPEVIGPIVAIIVIVPGRGTGKSTNQHLSSRVIVGMSGNKSIFPIVCTVNTAA